jgi:hypothetical protein
LNYKCVIDCSRKSAKIILRYPSSHYIVDPPIVLKDSTSRYEFSCEKEYDQSPKFITNSKLLEIFRNKGILNYKCVIDCSRKVAKIIFR